MKNIKKIDVHAHCVAWPEYEPAYYGTESKKLSVPELFEKYYKRLNVERAVLLPGTSPEGALSPLPTNINKYLADQYPDKLFWFCNVDPRQLENSPNSNLGYLLEFYKSIGAKGVGELTCNLYVDDPLMENLFYHCSELDLPVTIHIAPEKSGFYGIVDDLGLPRIEKMLKKYPKLKIFGHSQPFWSEIGKNTKEIRNTYPTGKVEGGRLPELLREYPNLYCDLSAGSGANALMRDREHAARFIEEFSDRIMYGCDICMAGQDFPFAFDEFLTDMLESGEISEANYRKLVRENAIRVLNLYV